MPFTPVHALAVVPLKKIKSPFLSFPALVIGSLSPDFIYLIPFSIARSQTHSIAGLFWFCLPLGLLGLWLYHAFLRRFFLHLMSDSIQQRLSIFVGNSSPFQQTHLLGIILSLIIGALTHIVWDGFTHYNDFAVQAIPALQTSLGDFLGQNIRVYKLLQYAFSILGTLLLVYLVMRWLNKFPKKILKQKPRFTPEERSRAWQLIFGIAFVFGLCTGMNDDMSFPSARIFTGRFIKGAMAGFFITFFALSVISRYSYKLRSLEK